MKSEFDEHVQDLPDSYETSKHSEILGHTKTGYRTWVGIVYQCGAEELPTSITQVLLAVSGRSEGRTCTCTVGHVIQLQCR